MEHKKIIINGRERKFLEIVDWSDIGETHIIIGHYEKTYQIDDAFFRFDGHYHELLTVLTHKLLELTEP